VIEPIVFIALTNLNDAEVLVRVDAIMAINTAVERGGAIVMLASRHCFTVTETPDDIRRKMAEAYELAAEALS
jgi:tripartite-type tricarboxylate transporter receptor subunit TctC